MYNPQKLKMLCLQFPQQVVQYVTVAHQLQSAVGIVEQGISAGVVENIESPLCIYQIFLSFSEMQPIFGAEIFIRLCQILRVFPHTASIMLYGNLPTRETNKCQSLYKQGALLQLPKGCGSEAGFLSLFLYWPSFLTGKVK